MASIHKRPTGSFQVAWRENGKQRTKTFSTKKEAVRFASLLRSGALAGFSSSLTLADVIQTYLKEVSPLKVSCRNETGRLVRILNESFTEKNIKDVTPADIEAFINRRGQDIVATTGRQVTPSTVVRDVNTLSAVFNFAMRHRWISSNPCRLLSNRPKECEPRGRVATNEEIEKLMHVSGWDGESVPANSKQCVMAAFLFACRTGMRASEILRIEPSWIDGDVIHLPAEAAKTRAKRDVALPDEAKKILALMLKRGDKPTIWRMAPELRDGVWRKMRDAAGLHAVHDSKGRIVKEGLNFHDSRATFATWAASPDPKTGAPRLDVLALAKQTGHKNLGMLQRYYRASASEIAHRLNCASKDED